MRVCWLRFGPPSESTMGRPHLHLQGCRSCSIGTIYIFMLRPHSGLPVGPVPTGGAEPPSRWNFSRVFEATTTTCAFSLPTGSSLIAYQFISYICFPFPPSLRFFLSVSFLFFPSSHFYHRQSERNFFYCFKGHEIVKAKDSAPVVGEKGGRGGRAAIGGGEGGWRWRKGRRRRREAKIDEKRVSWASIGQQCSY